MAKKNLTKGLFVTFEGPEGSGKTTHAKLIYDFLKDSGYDCVYAREPGGTKAGEAIRQVLLHSEDVNISDLTELFLFEAARAQIVNEIILPNRKKGRIIICDRFTDATLAYQGYGGGVPLNTINTLNAVATGALRPDITILLDVDTITGLRRARKKGLDRMEQKDIAYHKRVRAGYLALAKNQPERIKVVKVDKERLVTQSKVRKVVLDLINDK